MSDSPPACDLTRFSKIEKDLKKFDGLPVSKMSQRGLRNALHRRPRGRNAGP